MGTCILTLRKSGAINTDRGPVYRYKFNRQRDYEYFEDTQIQNRLDRHADRWEQIEDCLVTCAFPTTEGAFVWRQKRGAGVFHDDGYVKGALVGVLRKRGRQWFVSSLYSELFRYIMRFSRHVCRQVWRGNHELSWMLKSSITLGDEVQKRITKRYAPHGIRYLDLTKATHNDRKLFEDVEHVRHLAELIKHSQNAGQ